RTWDRGRILAVSSFSSLTPTAVFGGSVVFRGYRHNFACTTRDNSLQPISPQFQRLPLFFLVCVLDINSESNSCLGGCAVVGDVAKDDWRNAEFCHFRQCCAAQIMRRPMFP